MDNAIIQLGDIDDSQKGRQFKSRFIQAGIAGYPKQFGNVLITKETLDKFVNTLVDKPVIINHKDEIKKEDEVGKVTKVWFNSEDGWFWCEGYLTDETAINLIKDKGWSVSCSYDVLLLDDEGGTENNIKYDKEFLNGKFTHLAIVENPRYERANIVVNSKTEVLNSFEGHAGRKGYVGGSLPKGLNPNFTEELEQLIKTSTENKLSDDKVVISEVTPEALKAAQKEGVDLTGYVHTIDSKAVRHRNNEHLKGDSDDITDDDLKQIPEIIYRPDAAKYYKRKYLDHLNYEKTMSDGTYYYIEEVRTGKKTLTTKTIYKKVGAPNVDNSTLEVTSVTPSDNYIISHFDTNFNPNVKEDKTMEIDNARGFNGEEGDWITVKGVHVFVKKGQSKEEAVADFIEKQQGGSAKEKQEEKKSNKDTYGTDDKGKDLYSDENFKYNAKRLNEQFGEKPYSEWQKDVQTMLKKYGKTEEDWDNAIGARKDAFNPDKSEADPKQEEKKPSKEFFEGLEKQHKKMQEEAAEKEKTKLLDKDRLQKYKDTYEKNKKYIREHELSSVEREEAKAKQEKILAEIQKMEEAQSTEPKQEDKGNILEGGIKETKDKYGRTNFTKGNKWADVTSNGGRSDSWIAAYGLTHKSGVSWEAEKGITEEQLLNSRSFKTEKGARKWALEQLKRITSDNSKEQDMSLLNKLINLIKEVQNNKGAKMDTKSRILSILNEKEVEEDVIEEVENELEEIEKEKEEKEAKNKKCKNEKVDKRKLIDEVGGILKGKVDDEIIRTVIGKIEKAAYDESEAGADNKKAKNEDEEKDEKEVEKVEKDVEKDVDNKCKNSVYNAADYFNKVNEIYNSSCQAGVQTKYETQADRLEAGNKF